MSNYQHKPRSEKEVDFLLGVKRRLRQRWVRRENGSIVGIDTTICKLIDPRFMSLPAWVILGHQNPSPTREVFSQ